MFTGENYTLRIRVKEVLTMKDFFKQGKNIAILVLAIVLAGSVACNICLATRRCAPRGPKNFKQIEQFQGGQQGQMPQGQPPQGDNNQAQPPQGQPPQAPNGQQPNAQAQQDGQNSQKKDSDKKGNNDDKKDSDDDDDKDEKTNAQ